MPRRHLLRALAAGLLLALAGQSALQSAFAQSAASPRVVDIPTRPGVTQRFVYIAPSGPPKASVILMAGGHGGLQVKDGGSFGWGSGNFLVRTRSRPGCA